MRAQGITIELYVSAPARADSLLARSLRAANGGNREGALYETGAGNPPDAALVALAQTTG